VPFSDQTGIASFRRVAEQYARAVTSQSQYCGIRFDSQFYVSSAKILERTSSDFDRWAIDDWISEGYAARKPFRFLRTTEFSQQKWKSDRCHLSRALIGTRLLHMDESCSATGNEHLWAEIFRQLLHTCGWRLRDPVAYRNNHPDLKDVKDLHLHFFHKGAHEGRTARIMVDSRTSIMHRTPRSCNSTKVVEICEAVVRHPEHVKLKALAIAYIDACVVRSGLLCIDRSPFADSFTIWFCTLPLNLGLVPYEKKQCLMDMRAFSTP